MSRRAAISRRAFLCGAASLSIGLPFLDVMSARAQSGFVPKRFVVWFTPCGRNAATYPTSMNLVGTSLAPLEPFKDDLIVTKGLSMMSARYQSAADHPSGFGHMLTGDTCSISGDNVNAANISVDQFVAKRMGQTRFPCSLHGIDTMRPMSWDRSGDVAVPMMAIQDPRSAFDRLFSDFAVPTADGSPTPESLRRASIMDSVKQSYEDLRCKLGSEDQKRLDVHLEQLRAIEVAIETTAPHCAEPAAPPADINYDVQANHQKAGRAHMALLVKALECDLTRVGTLQWYSHTGLYGESYTWDGLGSHHEASHGNAHGAEDKVFAGELAHFLGLLREAKAEDGQSLLHHTVVLCVSELGLNDVGHHLADLGIVVAGRAGGKLKTGRYIDFLANHRANFKRAPDWKRAQAPNEYFTSFDVPHNNLLVELINAVSPDDAPLVEKFGNPSVCTGGLPAIVG